MCITFCCIRSTFLIHDAGSRLLHVTTIILDMMHLPLIDSTPSTRLSQIFIVVILQIQIKYITVAQVSSILIFSAIHRDTWK